MAKHRKSPRKGLESEADGEQPIAPGHDPPTPKAAADKQADEAAKNAPEELEGPEAEALASAEAEGMSPATPPSADRNENENDAPKEDKGLNAA